MTEAYQSVSDRDLNPSADGDSDALVREMLSRAPDVDGRRALAKLSEDQTTLLAHWMDGFDSRDDLLLWMQDVAINSLGQLRDDWFVDQLTDMAMLAALLEEPIGPITAEDLTNDAARSLRRDVAVKDLIGAFHAAQGGFRWTASERYDDEMQAADIDLEEQHPAMRPVFSDVSDQQEWALRELLDGFDSLDEIVIWGQYVTKATYAEVGKDTIRQAYFDLTVRDWMLGETRRDHFYRQIWGAKYLLSGFNRQAAKLASRSAESVEQRDSDMKKPRG